MQRDRVLLPFLLSILVVSLSSLVDWTRGSEALGKANEVVDLVVYGSSFCSMVVLEVQWSVRDRELIGWVLEDCPHRFYLVSLVVLGQIRTLVRIGELHLMLRIVAVTRSFPRVYYRWWYVVGGASRHLWQQRSINVIIKGRRINRRPEEEMKTGV